MPIDGAQKLLDSKDFWPFPWLTSIFDVSRLWKKAHWSQVFFELAFENILEFLLFIAFFFEFLTIGLETHPIINLIIKMEILPYYWTPWLSIWCHQNMTNPSQKSHPAWLKKWLMAFPNCTSMAIPLAQKEVLYEKIMSNFSKTSVWKEKLQFTAFFYNCKIFSDREIYILGCDLCIYIT